MFDKGREAIFDTLASDWGNPVSGPPADLVWSMLENLTLSGKTVLDVGAGTGALVEAGLSQHPQRWVCCDLSMAMLEQIRDKWPKNPVVEILQGDAHCLPLGDAIFDVVICNAVLPHFHNRRQALAELSRVLRQNGQLLINHFLGREKVNQIHQRSEHDLLRGDLLPEAEVVVGELEVLGYEIKEAIDREDRYLILATKIR